MWWEYHIAFGFLSFIHSFCIVDHWDARFSHTLEFFCNAFFFVIFLVSFSSVWCILYRNRTVIVFQTVTAPLTLACSTCSYWLDVGVPWYSYFCRVQWSLQLRPARFDIRRFDYSLVRSLVRVYSYHWVTGALKDVFLRNRTNFFRYVSSLFSFFYRLMNFIYVFMSNVAWNLLHTTTLIHHWRFECVHSRNRGCCKR